MPPLILKVGVPVLVVVLIGKARFKPQSPLFSDVFGVSSAALVGYIVVAVSDEGKSVYRFAIGKGSGDGMAKSLEFRNRFADGDSRTAVIAATSRPVCRAEPVA